MIYFVTSSSYPYGLAASKRTAFLADGLNREHPCKVLVCKRIISASLQKANKENTGIFNHVAFHYTTGRMSAHRNRIVRLLEDVVDAFRTRKYLKRNLHEGDVVYLYMRDNFTEFLLTQITHQLKCKCARELCELPYGTGRDTLYMKWMRFISLNVVLKRYDFIIPISYSLQKMAEHYGKKEVVITKVPILTNSCEMKSVVGNDGILKLFHAGSLTQQKDGILYIFEALGRLKQKYSISIPFYLTGNIESSPVSSEIKFIMNRYQLNQIYFLGYISDEEIERHIQESTFLVLYKIDNLQNKFCFATKLSDYMRHGKLVITTNVGEQMYYLRDKENCLLTPVDDVDALVERVRWVITHPALVSTIGVNAKKTCDTYFDYINNTRRIISSFGIS